MPTCVYCAGANALLPPGGAGMPTQTFAHTFLDRHGTDPRNVLSAFQ